MLQVVSRRMPAPGHYRKSSHRIAGPAHPSSRLHAPQQHQLMQPGRLALRRGGYGGGSLGPSWLISADLCERMASRRWAASLDSCSNSLAAVVLSWAKACLSTGGLPSLQDCDDLVLLRASPGRYAERAAANSVAVCERRVPAQPTGIHTKYTAPHSSLSLAISGAYLLAFSSLLMWQLRSAQKPSSIRIREHNCLSKSVPGDGEGIFGTPFA